MTADVPTAPRTLPEGEAAEVTLETAAALLGLSRPTLMRLVGRGELHSRVVAGQHRLRQAEVLAYRARGAATRREALEALSRLSEAHDL